MIKEQAMTKQKPHQHSTSLRLPVELHDWIVDYAKQSKASAAYIYRQALWQLKESSSEQTR